MVHIFPLSLKKTFSHDTVFLLFCLQNKDINKSCFVHTEPKLCTVALKTVVDIGQHHN